MADVPSAKNRIRQQLRDRVAALTNEQRHAKSATACSALMTSPEFDAARVVMVFLSMPLEIETSTIALKAWQRGKTVCVPKLSWEQRRMLPMEIDTLTSGMQQHGSGVMEPIGGKPVPVDMIDLVIVPGLGFTVDGHRIGRGMGFYDRFLVQAEFIGVACGLAFEEQVVPELPVLDHDIPLSMLATDQGIRRFASRLIQS